MKVDARKLDTAAQQEKRNIAIKMRESGVKNDEVARIVGVHRTTVSEWYRRFKEKGKDGIKIGRRGRRNGEKKTLTKEQEAHIVHMLVTKNPTQLQFKFALWTREAVQTLIKYELDIEMPISTVGYYLAKWEFTSKKPIKRAYERKDTATKAWLEEEYPRIKEQAKQDSADIWWADETACQSLPTNLKGYAPIGTHNKPVLTHTAKKFKINMISAITNTGKSMFALYETSVNIDNFIDFLQKVIDSNSKKVYLIVDNLRVHHAKRVKVWEEEHSDRIKLFYLPPYSPEFNPDEYLNQDYKKNANKNNIPLNVKQLENNTRAYMESLQSSPEKVSNFFKHPSVSYAA